MHQSSKRSPVARSAQSVREIGLMVSTILVRYWEWRLSKPMSKATRHPRAGGLRSPPVADHELRHDDAG